MKSPSKPYCRNHADVMRNADLHSALAELSVNQVVAFDDAQICLKIISGGAVLSAVLDVSYSPRSQQLCLECGFSWALHFDAGIAIDVSKNRLLLTQWLPSVQSWPDAANALEKILNQLDACRIVLNTRESAPILTPPRSRAEKRFRAMLSG